MVWKYIMMIFVQRQHGPAMEQIVQKLSETRLIRGAARLTAYHLLKTKDKLPELKDPQSVISLVKKIQDELIKKGKDSFKK